MTGIYKTLNILCVEDDSDVLEIYKALFSLMFKEVYFATNGKEGMECFNKHSIDIILTDFQMPIYDGLKMSKKIRELDASIPIVMVTALESIDMLREAIDLHITAFLKKPFTSKSLFETFNIAVKSIIVDRCMMKEHVEKILYNNYQEALSFDKEKTITKNDSQTTQKMMDFHCEVFYKPKDILSGDSYIIKKISDDSYLIFLVDGMGKGISASVTAMLCSAFVNYFVTNTLKTKENFSLKKLLNEFLAYIQPNLLEYEVVSALFLYFYKKELHYSIFSMPPPLYMQNNSDEVLKIKSNNPPLAPYTKEFDINILDIFNISKMLIFSDGLNESTIENSSELYNKELKKDFKIAKNITELQTLYAKKVQKQDDDITYVMLQKNIRHII